jgi:hypothetical protein
MQGQYFFKRLALGELLVLRSFRIFIEKVESFMKFHVEPKFVSCFTKLVLQNWNL